VAVLYPGSHGGYGLTLVKEQVVVLDKIEVARPRFGIGNRSAAPASLVNLGGSWKVWGLWGLGQEPGEPAWIIGLPTGRLRDVDQKHSTAETKQKSKSSGNLK
jgi:hypothetical protein